MTRGITSPLNHRFNTAAVTMQAVAALARARILLTAYCPPMPARGEVINNISALIEAINPRGGQRPRLVFRPAPTPAKRNGPTPPGRSEP